MIWTPMKSTKNGATKSNGAALKRRRLRRSPGAAVARDRSPRVSSVSADNADSLVLHCLDGFLLDRRQDRGDARAAIERGYGLVTQVLADLRPGRAIEEGRDVRQGLGEQLVRLLSAEERVLL